MYNLQMNQDLKLDIANNMLKYGGSFVKCLASCIIRADAQNLRKIEMIFPEYLSQYHPENWQTDSHRAVDLLGIKIEAAIDRKVAIIEQILIEEFLDKEYPQKPEFTNEGKKLLRAVLSEDLF